MSINSINNLGTYRAQMDAANSVRNKDGGTQKAASPTQAQATGDRISVSADAMLRTEAYKVASNTPDIRQEKINSLKERIATGSYQIDNKRIASKLVMSEVALFRK